MNSKFTKKRKSLLSTVALDGFTAPHIVPVLLYIFCVIKLFVKQRTKHALMHRLICTFAVPFFAQNRLSHEAVPMVIMRKLHFCKWEQQKRRSACASTQPAQLLYCQCIQSTVMILSFRTDRPWQTVQTQIRLLLEEQSDQCLHCLPFHVDLLDKFFYGNASLFEF